MHLMMCSGSSSFRKQMQGLRMEMHHYARGAAASTSDDPASER